MFKKLITKAIVTKVVQQILTLEFIEGNRTYVLAAAGGIYAVLIGLGIVPSLEWAWALIGSGAVATMRAGIAKAPQNNN